MRITFVKFHIHIFLKLNVLVASSASDSGGVLVFTFKCAYIHVTFLAVPAEGRVVF